MSKKDVITTILGKGCVVHGGFEAKGSTRIDGTVNGDVKVGGILVVGVDGKIAGDVDAHSVIIGGEVTGNIVTVEKAELTETAKVIGDLKTTIIVIDENAIFQGKVDMSQDTNPRKRSGNKATGVTGRKSAKIALQEAMKEMQESELVELD